MESCHSMPYRGYYPARSSCSSERMPRVEPFPLAMAYVPWQMLDTTFPPAKGLYNGTIFPELCKPFCGKGGPCA